MNVPLCFCVQGCKRQKEYKCLINNKTHVECSEVKVSKYIYDVLYWTISILCNFILLLTLLPLADTCSH